MITTMMALWKEMDCTGMKQLTDSWTPSDDNSSHGLRLHVEELIPPTIQNIIPPVFNTKCISTLNLYITLIQISSNPLYRSLKSITL
jgi:hypothetical protein